MKSSNAKKTKSADAAFYRFRELGSKVLVTNDAGEYKILDNESFHLLSEGRLDESHKDFLDLKAMGCVDTGGTPPAALVEKYKNKNLFLFQGTLLFIVIPTLRCNQKCVYCHASARNPKSYEFDMDIETAKQVVDTIFECPGINISLELQGGEPLLNWETSKFIINYAIEKNRMLQKNLMLSLVTNLSELDDEKLDFLIERKVGISSSLDGPEKVHKKNRGGNYKKLMANLKKVVERFNVEFDRYTPGLLTTVTRHSLPYPKEIVDTFVKLKVESIHLRHYNPVGFAQSSMDEISYTPYEFLEFYEKALDYIIEINKKGTMLIDRTAWLFLLKIMGNFDPNYMDLRSPCGAGIGQVAFNYDGSVYTCDEGRMLAMQGDDSFRMGSVFDNSYDELIGSQIVKQTCLASTLDGVPHCANCAYKPYCGVCPLLNYVEEGSLFARIPQNRRHIINRGILDMLFERIQDEPTRQVFVSWLERGINVV